MNKILAFIVSIIFGSVFALPMSAFAQSNTPANVILPKDQTINKDYFAAGESVTLSGTVNGDAYVAGTNVIIEGTVNGDLLAAGGTITIRGIVTQDIRVVGGQVVISGDVGRNLSIGGGSVNITDSAKIGGSLTAGAGNLTIFAPVSKDVNIAAGQATLGNTVSGDVQAGVGQMTLTSSANVLGNLTYWSESTAHVDSTAKITGTTTHNLPPQVTKDPKITDKTPSFLGINWAFNFWSYLGALVVGLLLSLLVPVYTQETVRIILEKPLHSLGIGFLSLVLAPFAFIFILITVIGIPLDLILLAISLILIYLAKIFFSIALGEKVSELANKKLSLSWTLVVGISIYYILSIIPILGFVFWMIAGFIGLGASLIEIKKLYKKLLAKSLEKEVD